MCLSLPLPGLISAPDESLFTYELDKGPLDFHDSDWMPTFTDDIISEASDEVKAACTPPGASEPLQQCLFDAVATGDVSVGMATANTLNENTQAMEESSKSLPICSSPLLPLPRSKPPSSYLQQCGGHPHSLPIFSPHLHSLCD